MPWGTVLVSIALVSGLYLGLPHVVTGTSGSEDFIRNGIPMIAVGILGLILVESIFRRK